MFPKFKESIKIGSLTLNFLFDGEDTDGALVQYELIVPPNAKVPAPHFHSEFDETFYVLSGILTLRVDDKIIHLHPGEKYFIKRGVVHGFNNLHHQNVSALSTLSPASIGPAYFRELSAVINTSGPPDTPKVHAIMEKYGIEPVK